MCCSIDIYSSLSMSRLYHIDILLKRQMAPWPSCYEDMHLIDTPLVAALGWKAPLEARKTGVVPVQGNPFTPGLYR